MVRISSTFLLAASVLVLASLVGLSAGQGFGSRLLRSFFVFAEQPLTASVAANNGWYRLSSSCDPNVGYAYAQEHTGPTSTHPVKLYYTAAGQLSGVVSAGC